MLDAIVRIVGNEGLLSDQDRMAPFLSDTTGRTRGRALAVARPRTPAQVSELVRLAATAGLHIVPQGGNTGLAGGGIPTDPERAILLSLSRMNALRAIGDDHIIAEAGCVLATAQAHAAEHGRLLPLALGAEGSCTIGGVVSTNAGGIRTLRHGNCRELVLGIEAVLPDGQIWNGLRTLRKDNSGYDLKHLLIGAEGTLGIVTAAALRLVPEWRQRATAFVAIPDPRRGMELLDLLRARLGDMVVACELMQQLCVELVLAADPEARAPFADRHPWYLLVELATSGDAFDLPAALEGALMTAIEREIAIDAVPAASIAARTAFWRLREGILEGQRAAGPSIKFDISISPGDVPDFIAMAGALAQNIVAGAQPMACGHVGDGNIHYTVLAPPEAPARLTDSAARITREIHALAIDLGGSISAEHGIGRYKRDHLREAVGDTAVDMMAAIKRAIDPCAILNPGVTIPAASQ